MKDLLHDQVGRLAPTLAADLKDAYTREVESFNNNLTQVLRTGFGLSQQDAFEFLSKCETQCYDFCA